MAICFAMVVTIALSAKQGETDKVEEAAEEDDQYDNKFYGILLTLGAAIPFAATSVANRNLKETPPPVVIIYFAI